MKKSRLLIYYVFSVVIAISAYDAARYVVAEASNQTVRNLMASIQNRRGDNLELLMRSAEDLVRVEPFAGALAATRADAMAMVHYLSPSLDLLAEIGLDLGEARKLFRRALEITPSDGYLWARYALFLDYFADLDQLNESSYALFQAMKNGPRDYNTMRIISELGIKKWPWLSCSQRQLLVQILDYAGSVDDLILARWNTDHRFLPLKQHLDKQYQYYEFDLAWAKRHVARCMEG